VELKLNALKQVPTRKRIDLLLVVETIKTEIMKTIKILALQKKVEELRKEIIRLNNLIKK